MVATVAPRLAYNADMPPRHNERGAETRDDIMRLIRQRDSLGLPPATVRGIAREMHRNNSGILRQLGILVELGDLERVEVAQGMIVYRLPSPRE